MRDHQTAIDVVTATGAAVASKTTYFSAFIATVASWVTHSPPGVIAGVAIAILTFLVNAGFRALADRRDRKHKAMEAELRRLEHEAYMRRYGRAARDTEPGPLV